MSKIIVTDFLLCKHMGENLFEVRKAPVTELDYDETYSIFYHKDYGCYLILDCEGRYINLDVVKAGAWQNARVCGMHLLWRKDYKRTVRHDEMTVY